MVTGPGFPARAADDVARIPGVDAVTSVLTTSVVMSTSDALEKYPTQAVGGTDSDLAKVLDLGIRKGGIEALRPGAAQPDGGAVAMDRLTADTVKARVGKPIEMRLGDGTRIKPTLVATYDRGLGTRRHPSARHRGAPRRRRPGRPPARTLRRRRRPRRRGHRTHQGHRATPSRRDLRPSRICRRTRPGRETNKWVNQVMLIVLAGFATIAAVNTMIVSTVARRRELGLMRMIGSTHAQVRGVMRGEAILVGVIGLVLGLTIAMITLVPFGKGASVRAPPTSRSRCSSKSAPQPCSWPPSR